jgi:hypothetical protein
MATRSAAGTVQRPTLLAVLATVLPAVVPGCLGAEPADEAVGSAAPWDVVATLGPGHVRYEWRDQSGNGPMLEGSADLWLRGEAHHPLLDAVVQEGTFVITGMRVSADDGDHNASSYWAAGLPIARGHEEDLDRQDVGITLFNAESVALDAVQLLYLPNLLLGPEGAALLPTGWPIAQHQAALRDLRPGEALLLDVDIDEGRWLRYTFDGSPWPALVEAYRVGMAFACCSPVGTWVRTQDTFQPTRDVPGPAWPTVWFEPPGPLTPTRPVPDLDGGPLTWGLLDAMAAAARDPVVMAFQQKHPGWFVDYAQTANSARGTGTFEGRAGFIVDLSDGERGASLTFYVEQLPTDVLGVPIPASGVTIVGSEESKPTGPRDETLVLPEWDSLRFSFVERCPSVSERPAPPPSLAFHFFYHSGTYHSDFGGPSPGLASLAQDAPSPDCSGFGSYDVGFGQFQGLVTRLDYTAMDAELQ